MKLILSAPSKTFLLGEYAVLAGGPALILNTEPRFELHVTEQTSFSMQNIEPQSPAGRFIQDNLPIFNNYHLSFVDPHNRQGGFGASSAQFLLAFSLYHALQEQPLLALESLAQYTSTLNIPASAASSSFHMNEFTVDLLSTYQTYAWNGMGIPPSGADVIAQLYGKLTWVNKLQQQIECFNWPFSNLMPILLRTGNKIATHEHLKQLNEVSYDAFASILNAAYQALVTRDEPAFIQAVNDYAQELLAYQLVAPVTQYLLEVITKRPEVLAAKGCGALGADVVLCVIPQDKVHDFYHYLNELDIQYSSTKNNLTAGLTIQYC